MDVEGSAVGKRQVPGTPIGGERTPLVPMTPDEAKQKYARLSAIRHNISTPNEVPPLPGSASSEPSVTLSALRDLFDEKLQPVTATLKTLRDDFEIHVDMTNTHFDNFRSELDDLRGQMRTEINDMKQHVRPTGQPHPAEEQAPQDDMKHKIAVLEKRLASLTFQAQDGNERLLTGVVGGLASFDEDEAAKAWLNNLLWEGWLPTTQQMYIKGDFKDIIFCKFKTQAERDEVVEYFHKTKPKAGGHHGMVETRPSN